MAVCLNKVNNFKQSAVPCRLLNFFFFVEVWRDCLLRPVLRPLVPAQQEDGRAQHFGNFFLTICLVREMENDYLMFNLINQNLDLRHFQQNV